MKVLAGMSGNSTFKIGDCLVEQDLDRISRGSETVTVRPQVMDVLVYLASRGGQIVHADELLENLWPEKVVTSASIYNCITELRQALLHCDDGQPYIDTVPKRGYRIVAPVTGLDKSKAAASQNAVAPFTRRMAFIVISLLAAAVILFAYDKWWGQVPPDKSIAVLPFVNINADEDSAYFSDGLADTILHMLAQIRELRVAARTSSFQFRDQSLDVSKIGEQLNVGTILEGSVQRSGDKIRVTAQLIDVSNGYNLWSGNFDRELEDVFAIQDEIATAVVSALKVSLLGESVESLGRDQTDNVDAYREYLLGINDLNVISTESIATAISHFQEAIRIDPDYASAHAMLGRVYIRSQRLGSMSRIEGLAAARVAANRALDLSPNSSTALAVLGRAELRDGNLDTAGQILGKAVEVGPNDTFALNSYAEYLAADGRTTESIEMYRRILRLDPLSERALEWLAYLLTSQQRFSEASETIARWKSIYPMSPLAAWHESINEWQQGNLAAAVAPMTDGYLLDRKDPEYPWAIGFIHLEMDMPTEASQWFDRAVEINAQHPVSRAAPIWLNYYLKQNGDENVRLARELLNDRIDNRNGSREIALRVLIEYAAKTGRHDVALESLDNLYPRLFDDPPHVLNANDTGAYYAGIALMQSGDVERGLQLIQIVLDREESREAFYGVRLRSVVAQLLLGDTDGALGKLEDHSRNKYSGYLEQIDLERNSVYDPIRNEPAFIALLGEYRDNAAKQRQIMQAMNEDKSGQ